jgi:hypothetical protein
MAYMSIKITGEIKLEDGTVVKIDQELAKLYDLKRCIVKEVYRDRISRGETKSSAAMNTAILCGYEASSAIVKMVE